MSFDIRDAVDRARIAKECLEQTQEMGKNLKIEGVKNKSILKKVRELEGELSAYLRATEFSIQKRLDREKKLDKKQRREVLAAKERGL